MITNEQINQDVLDIEADDDNQALSHIKILFVLALFQLTISCGMLYLQIGFLYYSILQITTICYTLLLIYWCWDQYHQTTTTQDQSQELTNNFSTRLQIVISISLLLFIIYSFMTYTLISITSNQQQLQSLYQSLTMLGYILQITIQIGILIKNAYFCQSPNILRLSIHFQSIILILLILGSIFWIYKIHFLPIQLQVSSSSIKWNTILQIPTMILVAISILFNYTGNKKAYSIFGTIFLVLSILHIFFGCLTIRNAQFWIPSNEQLPLRALHQNIIKEFGCNKYYDDINCPLNLLVEEWELNQQFRCLDTTCETQALNFVKNLSLKLGLAFLFEGSLLFVLTYTMFTIASKYVIRKILNPITQRLIIILFYIIMISGIIFLYVYKIQPIETQSSMNYGSNSSFLPQFNQYALYNQNSNSNNHNCTSLNQLQQLQSNEAINCETSCSNYEFIVALSSQNSNFQINYNNEIKLYNQEFTNKYYLLNNINQQLVFQGKKNQIIQAFQQINICTNQQNIDINYDIFQKQNIPNRLLQQLNNNQQQKVNLQISFKNIMNDKIINKGTFRVYKQFEQCSFLPNEQYFEEQIKNVNMIYNVNIGQQLTILVQSEKYYQYCSNIIVNNTNFTIELLKKQQSQFTIILKQNSQTYNQIYLMANQQFNKDISCQVGGYFTGCSNIVAKQTQNYSILQFKEVLGETIIFISDYINKDLNYVNLNIQIYNNFGYNEIRQMNIQMNTITKILCLTLDGQIRQLQESSSFYPKYC